MNRPFYAIGVLLAFLAVAMMAVGLSSRPTGRPASAQSGSGIIKPRRGPGSVVFLLAVPDEVAEESAAELLVAEVVDDVASQPSYAEGCGLDRGTGFVYAPQTCADRVTLKATVVSLASETVAVESLGPMDCLSHCDAAYDAAIYGENFADSELRDLEQSDLNSGEFSYPIEAEDQTLTLFRSLLGEQFEARAIVLPRAKSASRNWRYELNAWRIGAGNQAWQSAVQLGLADEWERWAGLFGLRSELIDVSEALPTWADYQDWSDSAQAGVASQDTPTGETAILGQPWRHVLQFAVASLNHAAKTLGAAAERLDSLDQRPTGGPVGWRGTDFQPR